MAEDKIVCLTKDEAKAIYNHLDYYIVREIKDLPDDYVNVNYFCLLAHVYERCKEITMRSEE